MSTELILSAITGLVSGSIGSLIAPWVHWGIKKKEIRHNKRLEIINAVRLIVQNQDFNIDAFRETSDYSRIRLFLDKQLCESIESSSNQIVVNLGENRGSGIQDYKNQILDNLTKLETKWGLI